MDTFARFNRKNIDDRQIDTLIGISKGLTADGKIDQAESEFLLTWLIQSRQTTNNPIIINLLEKVSSFLEDDNLDEEESGELFALLHKTTGDSSEVGEISKTSSLPLCSPRPEIIFANRTFLFTGTCAYGTRKECQAAVEGLGGNNAKSVTKTLDYLVLGTYVTDSWIHENYGRKIEKAMKYRDDGVPLAIVAEGHWADAGSIA